MSVAQRTAVRGRLALCFQEVFTATARLRDGRQVPTDAGVFRAHVKQLLATADETARRIGYPPEFVKASVYATVALLDESMLSSAGASLSSTWAGRPLQDEIFGDNVAGEAFFQQLQDLLSRQDSPYVADVLEVLLLCLYLGFKGRYAATDSGELHHYMSATNDKIMRVRGGAGTPFAPDALPPPDEAVTVKEDAVQKRLVLALGVGTVGIGLAVGLLRLFSISPGVTRIQDLITNIGL